MGAQKIVEAIAGAAQPRGPRVHITVSIGISVYPDDGEDAETLLQSADTGAVPCEGPGADCYPFFKLGPERGAVERQRLIGSAQSAQTGGRSSLHYQRR